MKTLYRYIKEEGACMATPGNTMGMGNPGDPGCLEIPIAPANAKSEKIKKKKKAVKESLFDDEDDALDSDELIQNQAIEKFIYDNYKDMRRRVKNFVFRRDENTTYVDVEFVSETGTMISLNENASSITGGLFKWGKRIGKSEFIWFYINNNDLIDDLSGMPDKCSIIGITNCNNLKNLKYLSLCTGSTLKIEGCKSLESLGEIDSNSIYMMKIANCPKLKNLKGCPKKIDELTITDSDSIENLVGISPDITKLILKNLSNLRSLRGIKKVRNIHISNCWQFEDTSDLSGKITTFSIYRCSKWPGFENNFGTKSVKNIQIESCIGVDDLLGCPSESLNVLNIIGIHLSSLEGLPTKIGKRLLLKDVSGRYHYKWEQTKHLSPDISALYQCEVPIIINKNKSCDLLKGVDKNKLLCGKYSY